MFSIVFNQYQRVLNNASGTTLNLKQQISGTCWIEIKITSLTGSQINPYMNLLEDK